MSLLTRFLRQPSRAYRDFGIVYAILVLNFLLPALSYAFAPQTAMASFSQLNELLGGPAYTFPEWDGAFFRYLGTANVFALAFMCALILFDLRRNYPVVLPLTFLKATAATLWVAGYLARPDHPAFLAAGLFDFLTCAAFVFFARRAHRDIASRPDAELVPRPGVSRTLVRA